MLEDLKTKHVTYNVDSSTALKEFKANVLSYYNDYPDFIPSLVIFHISTDKILQFEHSSTESWWSTDPITGERDKNKSTYRIKQWQINADSFKLALYSGIYC